MAEKKSWRDYSKNSSTEEDSTEKTGTWRDYTSDKSTSGKTSSGWRNYTDYDPTAIVGNNIVNRVNSWLQNHNSYISDYQKRYEGRKGTYEDAYVSDSADWLETARQRKSSLDSEADAILSYIDQYDGYLDEKWADNIRKTLTGTKGTLGQTLYNANKDNEFWSGYEKEDLVKQYGSAEEAYKADQRKYGYSKTYTGKTTSELDEIIANLDDGEEKDWLTSYRASVELDEMGKYDLAAGQKEIEKLEWVSEEMAKISTQYFYATNSAGMYTEEEADEIRNQYHMMVNKWGTPEEFDAMLAKKKQYLEQAKYIQELNTWSAVAGNEDFAQNSQYVSNVEYELFGKPSFTDKTYAYLNNPTVEDKRPLGAGEISARELIESDDDIYKSDTTSRNRDSSYERDALNYIKEDEVKIYNYYYATEGKEKADEYLDLLVKTFKERKYADAFTKAYKLGSEHPFWGSVLSVGTSLGSGFEYIEDVIEYGADKLAGKDAKLDTNELALQTNAIRGAVADKVDWEVGNWDAFDFVYNTTMSGIDSLASTAFGKAGGVVLGLSAAAQGTNDALDRGMSDGQAFWNGLFSGVFEGLFESVSIGNFNRLKEVAPKNIKDIAKNLGKSMLVNASEETATEIANIVYDTLVNGEFANYTMEELKNGAWKQALGQVIEAGASGALMGVGMGAVSSTIGNTKANMKAKAEYGGKTDTLINHGLQNDVNTESYKLATKYQQKVQGTDSKKGKALTGAEIRKLLAANQDVITAKDMKKIQQAAEKRLTELGQTDNVAEVAEIATKWATGQEITRAEKKLLTHSQYGSRVANELLPENILSDRYTSRWAEDIGTESINKAAYNKKAFMRELVEHMTNPNAYQSLESRMEGDTPVEVSDTGKAVNRATGEEVDLTKPTFKEITEDGVVLDVNGESVSSNEIDYDSEDQGLAINAIGKIEHITPAAASALYAKLDKTKPVMGQLNGMDEAFTYGYYNYAEADLEAGLFTGNLTKEQLKDAYGLGRYVAEHSTKDGTEAVKKMRTAVDALAEKNAKEGKETPKAKKLTITYNHGGGVVEDIETAEKKLGKLKPEQRAGIEMAKILHQMGIGTDYEFFTSYFSKTLKDENGNPLEVFLNDEGQEEAAYAGIYFAADGKIRINLNAYSGTKGLTLNALSHELTHFIKTWNLDKYNAMAEYLVKSYGEKGVSMHKLVLKEQARLTKIRKQEVGYGEAYDEVVANAFNRMLEDGKVMDRIAEIRQFDKSLGDKIIECIRDFIKRFMKVYQDNKPLFNETKALMEMKDVFEQLQNMFAEALVEASDNFQASLIAKEAGLEVAPVENSTQYSYQSLAEAAGFEAVENEDGTRSFTRDGNKVNKVTVDDIENSPIGAFINFSLEMGDISDEDAKRQKKMFADICTMACKTNDFAMTMQFVGSAVFTGMKANADKQYGTTYDFPSICTKTQAVIDAMSAKMMSLGRGLNTDEIVQLYNDVFASGNPVPCPECYVFSRWIGIGGLLDNIKKYQDYYGDMSVEDVAAEYRKMKAEVSKFAEEQGISFGKAKGALTSKLTKEFNKLTEKVEKAQNQGEKVKPADLKRLEELEPMMNTVKGMTWLENVYFADSSLKKVNPKFRVPNEVLFDLNNGEAFATKYKDAWAFRTTQGAGYGKAITPYADARLGEGVLVTNNTTNAIKGKAQGSLDNYFLNQKGKLDKQSRDALKRARLKQKIQAFIGGQRFQSTSDARYENASDYLLAALEMQAMRGMVQVYTKVDGAVPAFSAWGFSINQSLMPLNGGLDANGNVKDTSVGGMKPEVAFENRNKHESAGTITIGVNDNHIRAMFKQLVRDFIIPYHASGGKADVVAEFRRIQEGKEAKGKAVRSTDYSRTQSDKILSDEVLRWQGKTDAQIQRIHEIRNARIAILTGGNPNMTVVRSNRFLSALYDKLNGGEWDGVKLAKSKVESQIFPNEFWDQTVTYEESAKITKDYLEYCEDLGFLHRFSGTVPSNGKLVPVNGYNENGERVQMTDLAYKYDEKGNKTTEVEEFFWKVLTDRRMYDNNGNYLAQKVVTLNDTTTDTVTGFAKNNQGRQYDKAKAEALAQKILKGEQYSSQQTDADYKKPITEADIAILRSIGRKSVNDFTPEDIQKAQKWAYLYRELKVKSPFFRAWFGDWRAFEGKKVSIAKIPQYVDSNEERKKNRGAVENEDTSWTISISREGETNTISHAGKERLSEYGLAGIKELISHAKLLDTEVHEHHSNNAKNDLIAFDHKLYALGENENGEVALYRITVEDYFQSKKQPSNKRFHNLKHIEKIADITGGRTSGKNRSGGSTNGKSAITYTVADLVKFVNMYDSEYTSPKQSSVVVENGEPLVVYHGSPMQFTTYDTSKGRYGIYLTANKQLATSYGHNIMESYVSMKNPKYIDAGYALANTLDMSKIAREAESENYDGVIITNLVHAGNTNYEAALRELAPEAMKEKEQAEESIRQINEATGYLDKIYDITDSEYSIPNMPLYTEPNLLWWAQKESGLVYDERVSKKLAKLEPIQKEIATYVERYNRALEAIRKAEKENASSIADTVYVVFKSEQVKAAYNNIGTYSKTEPNTLYSSQQTDLGNAPTFYSQMGKVVEGMKQDKFGASSVISMLRGRGVKAEEIRWSGIQAFLDGKKSVTKQELLDFINGSMLQIEETLLDGSKGEPVKLPNNYRLEETENGMGDPILNLYIDDELVDTFEQIFDGSISSTGDSDIWAMNEEDLTGQILSHYAGMSYDEAYGNGSKETKWDKYTLDGGDNYRELLFKMPGSAYDNQAMEAHWGDRGYGVLAHARIQDFNTFIGKMLFIEEIQSDWHNAGHKEGYRKAGDKTAEQLRKESDKAYSEFYGRVESMFNGHHSRYNPALMANLFEGDADAINFVRRSGFTDEEMKYIKSAISEETARKAALESAPSAGAVPDAPFKDNYHEYVLKRLLRMAAEEGYDSIGWTTADIQSDRWSSEYAEGYRIEYDQDIPKFLKKYGKQWDSTVGKTTLDNGTEVWSMAITDAMQKSVLKEGQAMYSTQQTDNITDRDMLANAFETISKNSEEYEMIQEYKSKVNLLNKLEQELNKVNQEIRDIRFGTKEYDGERLNLLEGKAKRLAKDITKHDKRLLNMEASAPLRRVIQEERKKEAQKTKAHVKEIQQNKKLRAEQTELRHKIRKTIRDLNKILNRGNKKQNVKEDMKGFVSKALELADYLFTDHISNDDLIRKGITVRMTPKEAALVKETEEILSQLYDNADSLTDEEFTRLDAKRKANEDKLRDLLTAQRNERLNTPVYNLFNDLVTEYASLKNSNQEAVKGAYDPKVEEFLRSYLGENADGTDSDRKTLLQNMRVADMTTEELWKLHNAYTMVLHSVRQANSLFVKGKTESIEQMAGRIMSDFSKRKAPDGKVATVIRNLTNKLGWDYEKLYYALDRIGSEAFTELVMNLADAENTVMQDIMEAVAFRDEIVKKYDFNNWAVNKEIDKEFLDNTGKKFKLTLGQLMSLYAYSRREGAWDHIEYGGFVFGEAALTNPKPADSYKLSKAQCEAITNTLTKEQKGYVEDMQKFLSETMGAKGNEVSMLLYGINMFGEKNYFPIHIAGQFKAQAQESQAKAAAGFSSMTNAGFTHAQNPNAKAPFVLEGFNEIWADHVNEMSRYHGTVPALEDMRRVMNRSSYAESESESMAIKQLMENSFGKEAVEYFDNLYREANSGAIADRMQRKSKKFLSMFRKNSVAYSLSVVIQQPSAMARAYAMIDKKYFGFKGVGALTSGVAKAVSSKWNPAYANAYNEMLKYAPGVTMAKEIGGFDTHTGSSIREYLLDTGKSFKQSMKTENLKGKGKAVLDLVDDNAIANLPSVADKIAWIEIWNACKRETVAKHKDIATNSEEFMQAVGERFTEVIRATQVYDSIFAKSPMLKSKALAVQYLVSFMNEPNTTANMVEKAVRDATKGDWKGGLRTAGAVTYSIIFNNVLKAIVYAMRDDDEDETYIEKYLAAVAGGMMDDFNALNYIPLVRDVWSKVRGYDVERPDMAIISDAYDAYKAVTNLKNKDTEDMTDAQIAELDKKMTEASWKLVGSLAAFFGIPVKNIYREIEGVIDHARIASANAGMTTVSGIWDKVKDEVIGSIPFLTSENTKTDKLYDAIVSGDAKYLERMKGTYKTEDAYQSAVRKALRENDPRIREAAQARYDGNTEEYKRIFREIQKEGKFSFDDIMSAVNSEVSKIRNGLEPEKATSDYTANGYVEAIAMGNATEAQAMKDDIISAKVANGKTQAEAEKEFKSAVATGIGEAYSSGLLDEAQAEKMLMEYAGKDKEEAASKVGYWSFLDAHPEYDQYDLSESNVGDYLEFAEPAEIPMDVFVQYRDGVKGLETIKDEWGDVEVTKREQVLEVINSLPLTWEQKDALYLAAGYSESKIWDVPW